MSVQSKLARIASSPISLSSTLSSPLVISSTRSSPLVISSDPSTAQESDVLSYSQTIHWPNTTPSRRITLDDLAPTAGVSGSGVSRAASLAGVDLGVEVELGRLREERMILLTENSALKGQVDTWS
jgi:hypothetical protein